MPTCPNGASPKPTWTAGDVILSVAGAGLLTVAGLAELAPFLVTTPVIGSISAVGLCNLNATDPGDFQLSYLTSPVTPGDLPSPLSQSGTMSWWIWNKTVYWFFQDVCQCNGAAPPPPPPIQVTPITNYDTSVNLSQNQTQLTIIQNNTTTGGEGQKELYNAAQHGNSLLGELFVRNVPNLIDDQVVLATGLTGEGTVDLPLFASSGSTQFSTSIRFVVARIDTIGDKVGIRGTLNPRYYGVGSLMFQSYNRIWASYVTSERQSIHHQYQTIPLPRTVITDRVAYRLMPGNTVSLFAVTSATDNVMLSPSVSTSYGWLPYGNYTPPAGWTDPPIYGAPSRRIFPVAGGSADYLRLDSGPLAVPKKILTDVGGDPECGCVPG